MMMDNNFEKAFGEYLDSAEYDTIANELFAATRNAFWRDGLPQEGVSRLPDISLRDMEKRMNLKNE